MRNWRWNEEVLVELGSWVLLIVVCLLLGMLVSGCRTKSVVCGITEEYADSLKSDSTVKETYVYSGKSLAEEISMEEVEIDWEDSASVESVMEILTGAKKLKAGKISIKRMVSEEQIADSGSVETSKSRNLEISKIETKAVKKSVNWMRYVTWILGGVFVMTCVVWLLWVNRKRISARLVSFIKRIE